MPQPRGSHVIGYARVSTEEQAASGLGLEAQAAAIADATTRRGWSVEYLTDAAASGKHVNPELRRALGLLATGQADALVVAKMDRLARSVSHASEIWSWRRRRAGTWSYSTLVSTSPRRRAERWRRCSRCSRS